VNRKGKYSRWMAQEGECVLGSVREGDNEAESRCERDSILIALTPFEMLNSRSNKSNNPMPHLSIPPFPTQPTMNPKPPKPSLNHPRLPITLRNFLLQFPKTLNIMLPNVPSALRRTLHIRSAFVSRVQMSRHTSCDHDPFLSFK
jgi:hypothetical protein